MAGIGVPALNERAVAEQHPDLYNSLIPLLRTEATALDAYLEMVACNTAISSTNTRTHCYFIALDGNKRPRVKDFAKFIGAKITDFAIPRIEISRALNEALRNRSTAPIDLLNTKARKLFTKLPKSGEGGEVLLSILAETFLRLPQLFTKMVLKTSPEMHVHGSDGIHVGVNDQSGNLAVLLGRIETLQGCGSSRKPHYFSSLAPLSA